MVDKIEGPLGIWPYPILNTIITIVQSKKDNNTEVIEFERDENGKIQQIIKIRE